MKKSTAVLLGVGVAAAAAVGLYLYLRPRLSTTPVAVSLPPWLSSTGLKYVCYRDPTLNPNPGIFVINSLKQMIPGAKVYIDGQYVGTTSADPATMGYIWPKEFTPCAAHQVTAVACDGTSATATLGYYYFPGMSENAGLYVRNGIVIPTSNCGGSVYYQGQ
jgi:hypothetical protein